ncbi:DUF445 domain-containing protein [Paenibacillus thermotolerans]|uniref:DUF445 domain-containing protein n=1 Tax=Paenibacillus thermotolerans TaxID=3027807 RepID=UPI00236804A3|nr:MULTISPECIES: DUF445 domain-containing protein [unclassified Paenibacillus]
MAKRSVKHTATISLGVMGAGFLATFPIADTPYGILLQSGFEAGLAGGLADWFAVTALFRHPLGLPIPHTALLPKNREKVTNALVNAIQTNLLNKESIIEKLKGVSIAEKIVQAVRGQLKNEETVLRIVSAAESYVRQIDTEAAARALAPAVRSIVRELDAAPLVGKAAEAALSRKLDETAFDYVLTQAERFAVREDTRIRMGAMAAKALENVQLGGFMGFAVNAFAGYMNPDRLGGIIQEFLLSTIQDMRFDANPYRQDVLRSIRGTMENLPNNPKAMEEIEAFKLRIAESEELERALAGALTRVQAWAAERLSDPSFREEKLLPFLERSLEKLSASPGTMDKLNAWIQQQIGLLVERNHGAIGRLVKENADKLSNEELIDMMEEHIGKDIQWIRVNGAICGFAIGLGLGLIRLFM